MTKSQTLNAVASKPLLDKATATHIAREMVKKFCPFQHSPMAMGEQPDFNHPVFQAHKWLIKKLSNKGSSGDEAASAEASR